MRTLAIVRDAALIVCALTLTLTTLYFANEYRELKSDLATIRSILSGEARERVREQVERSVDSLRDRARERLGRDKDK
jgi:hypothetical protein